MGFISSFLIPHGHCTNGTNWGYNKWVLRLDVKVLMESRVPNSWGKGVPEETGQQCWMLSSMVRNVRLIVTHWTTLGVAAKDNSVEENSQIYSMLNGEQITVINQTDLSWSSDTRQESFTLHHPPPTTAKKIKAKWSLLKHACTS